MKKSMLVMCLVASVGFGAQVVLAEETGAGCGIGKMVMEGKSTKGANIAAAIINDVLIPKTSFMTTAAAMGEEILGCDTSKTVMNEANKKAFVAVNMDNLSREMAQGRGVHLEVLADLMGVAEEDKMSFYSMAQEEYTSLAPASGASANEVLSSLNTAMLEYPELAKYIQ